MHSPAEDDVGDKHEDNGEQVADGSDDGAPETKQDLENKSSAAQHTSLSTSMADENIPSVRH